MKFLDEQLPLSLVGGVVQAQTYHAPPELIKGIMSYRNACRLAWRIARMLRKHLTKRTLAELADLYPSHVSEYFSPLATTRRGKPQRELPARSVAPVERVLGNTIISQYLAHQACLTVLEELQAWKRDAA